MRVLTEKDIAEVVQEVLTRLSGNTEAHGCGCSPTPAPAGSCSCEKPADKSDANSLKKQVLQSGADRVSLNDSVGLQCGDIASYIDHTLLKPSATEREIETLCVEARTHKFASVCVNTSYVEACARYLVGSGVKVCCVVGFPLGAMTTDSKAFETRDAVACGAEEIDMVINVGKLQSGNFSYVYNDIHSVVKAAQGFPVKVILETGLLSNIEKISACVLCKAAGASFVKTSTGFGPGGATAEDIALMRSVVGDQMGVKASGGIRDCDTAQKMIQSGASRIGASASVAIIKGEQSKSAY